MCVILVLCQQFRRSCEKLFCTSYKVFDDVLCRLDLLDHSGAFSASGPVVMENEIFTSDASADTLKGHSTFPPAWTFFRPFSPETLGLIIPPQK